MTGSGNAQTKQEQKNALARYIPILGWLPQYDKSWLKPDLIASLTLWGLVVPEAMAYAGIANLPPQAGLYTLLAALLMYAIFGSSRELLVGGTSATAALLASTVIVPSLAGPSADPATYQAFATAFVLVVGLVFLIAWIARLGFITQFLSKPVMDGFIAGLAIFVVVGQINKLFGVVKPHGNTIEKGIGIIMELPNANWIAFAIGALALATLFLLPRVNKKIPAGLVVLFGTIIISSVLGLKANFDVDVVGALPQGLPVLVLPQLSVGILMAMVLPAIGVVLVAYSEALGVAREFAEKHGYEVSADQELGAHAFANIASSLFGGIIAAGSMSASAVKEEAGARTQVTNLAAWVITIFTVLFLTGLFTSLPEAVLAALIIHALWHIIVARKLKKVRLVSQTEFLCGGIAFLGVLFFDVLEGMILGLAFSLIIFIYRSSRPHVSSLGRVPGVPGVYTDQGRHPENIPVPGVLIVRLDAPMFFANALTVRDNVKAMLEESEAPIRTVILDATVQDDLDVTSSEVITGLVKEMQGKGIAVLVADMHAPVRDFSQKTGLLGLIGEKNIFPTLDLAVRSAEASNARGAGAR